MLCQTMSFNMIFKSLLTFVIISFLFLLSSLILFVFRFFFQSIIVTNPKADELTKNNNDITDETLKTDGYSSTRQKAASQNKDEQQEQQLNRASSLSTLEDSTLNSTAYLINCTNCFSLNRQKSRKSLKKKSQAINKANPRIAVSSSTSISGTKSKNILNKVRKQKPNKSQAQFLIKFHQFSLRSPFCTNSQKPTNSKSSGGGTLASRHNQNSLAYNNITTVNNNNNNNASSPMNQRCCLSVSVVPSDKHNAKRRHVSSKLHPSENGIEVYSVDYYF